MSDKSANKNKQRIKDAFESIVVSMAPHDVGIPNISVCRDLNMDDDLVFKLTIAFPCAVIFSSHDKIRQTFLENLNDMLIESGFEVEFGIDGMKAFIIDEDINSFVKLSRKVTITDKDKLSL